MTTAAASKSKEEERAEERMDLLRIMGVDLRDGEPYSRVVQCEGICLDPRGASNLMRLIDG